MDEPTPKISDLKAPALVERCGLSKSYASELLNGVKRPSLEVAVRIEREFGVPASAWMDGQERPAA
jgi:transcriptional regulator with XRE-family HTH domain